MTLVDEPTRTDAKAGWSSYCRRDAHESCARAAARCTCSCHGARGQEPPAPRPAPAPQRKEPTVSTSETPTPPQPQERHQCSECPRNDFLTPHALAVHLARGHGVRSAAKTARKATRPAKAAAPKEPKRFTPADEPLDLDPPTRTPGLVVKRQAPGGPELRLLVDVAPDVVEVLAWLGVPTMVVDLAVLETV